MCMEKYNKWKDRKFLNEYQREKRKLNGNLYTRTYEKTINGFLMRMYRNMKSRVSGIQQKKAHLYSGKYILPREEFYKWAKPNKEFLNLFYAWEKSGYNRRLTPTVDRIDPSRGYELKNMEWVTHSLNSSRANHNRKKKI